MLIEEQKKDEYLYQNELAGEISLKWRGGKGG